MPAISTFAKAVDDCVTVRIPEKYRSCSFRVVLMPVGRGGKQRKYDFSGVAGRLSVREDPVTFQRRMRDEW